MIILPLIMFPLNHDPIANRFHTDLIWLEVGHVQIDFELFVIILHLLNSKHKT